MIKKNLSKQHFLEQMHSINNLFEQLQRQMSNLGYPETRLWVYVAKQSSLNK